MHKLQRLADSIDIAPGSAILDVGSGTGVFVPFLLAKIGPNGRLVCLDFAEQMLEMSKNKCFKGNIEYLCADIADTGIDDGTFDCIVCYSSFPHFQDKPKALREMNRLLKHGGLLSICHSSSRETINNIHRDLPQVCHDLIPDREEMMHIIAGAGFRSIQIEDIAESYCVSAVKDL